MYIFWIIFGGCRKSQETVIIVGNLITLGDLNVKVDRGKQGLVVQ